MNQKDFIKNILVPFMKKQKLKDYADIELCVKEGAEFKEQKLGRRRSVNVFEKNQTYRLIYEMVNKVRVYDEQSDKSLKLANLIKRNGNDKVIQVHLDRLTIDEACELMQESCSFKLSASDYHQWLNKQDKDKYPSTWREANKLLKK